MEQPSLPAVDMVAKAQLALIHAAVARPAFGWETVQALMRLWLTTNGVRYRSAGLEVADVRASLRMVFRDYVQAIRADNPAEADRFRQAVEPELDA